jgi:hypothetical protein
VSQIIRPSRLPRWWFWRYVLVLVVFTGMIGFLITIGVTPLVAVGVPGVLSALAVSALSRMAVLDHSSSPGDPVEQTEPPPEALPDCDPR